MMDGWDIVQYWGDRTDAPCRELVTLHTEDERQRWYPGLNPSNVATLGGTWDCTMEPWQVMNARAITQLRERLEPHDLILLAGGWAHHPVANAFPAHTVCEYGVGYYGWFTNFVCFESHAWRHHCYGKKDIQDGRWYDTVIPNYFDPAELPQGRSGGDYLVYLGRLIARKGLVAAVDVARESGMPLLVAGPGAAQVSEGLIVCEDGLRLEGDIHYVGTVGIRERAELLGNALALLCPTGYIEPFGGVAVEAQMCGTPAIASDWGAFCVPVDAEILTQRGWLRHDEVEEGDETLGYDLDQGALEWTPIRDVHVFPDQETTEYRNRNWRIRTTEGHRWLTEMKRGSQVAELLMPFSLDTRDRVRLAAEAPDGALAITPQQASVLGWLLTDGSTETRMVAGDRRAFLWDQDPADMVGKPRVWQSKPHGLAALRLALQGVPHTETGRANGPGQLPRRVFRIDPGYVRAAAREARISELGFSGFVVGLSRDSRQAFLRACIDAEGNKASKGSTILISQNEGPLMEAIALCAYLCGHRPTISSNGERNKVMALCNPFIAPSALHMGPGRVETVWCPSTDLGSWTMRHDGHIVLTGNTETVEDKYRFRTLREGVACVETARHEKARRLRKRAIERWSLQAVKPLYERWFDNLDGLRGKGWYEL
jgi:hypothetical protein